MNLDATFETVAAHIPDKLNIAGLLSDAASRIPADIPISTTAKFLFFFVLGSLVLSILGRIFLGRHSSLNKSLSSAMGILFLYAVTVIVYTFLPWDPQSSVSPLPFVTFFNDHMVVMPVEGVKPTVLSQELLSLIILSFLYNFIDLFIPLGKNPGKWYLLRFLTIGLAMGTYLGIHWAFHAFFPEVLVTYAPIILLLLLVTMLLLGFLNAVLGLILTITNPLLGAAYTFFFSNIFGKQFTKAAFTAGILSVIVFLMGDLGYSFLNISAVSLTACLPVSVVTLILWYLIGHLL